MPTENQKYVRKIALIILLTNIPILLILPVYFSKGIGWMLGSMGSLFNFLWMSRVATTCMNLTQSASKLRSFKGFYLRFSVLLLYSVLVAVLVQPDLLVFGLALLMAQFAIYIEFLYTALSTGEWKQYLRR